MAASLDSGLQTGLGVYYALCATMNAGFGLYYHRYAEPRKPNIAYIWYAVAGLFLLHAGVYFAQLGWVIPNWFTDIVNLALNGPRGATIYVSLSVVAFVVLLYWRKVFVDPQVAWGMLMASLFLGGWAMTEPNFRNIVAKEDNVPITMLIYSVGFFTWLALYRGVQNDERIARNEPVLEKLDDDKVLVWPDLVYTEMIAMIIATVVLIIWAVLLKAPLEQPATNAKAPNPSKAPWYFLGLQEMLVYFDPWMAGVVLPSLIVVGLMALPYIDYNREGNGYFTFSQRPFAVTTFLFGFLVLWVVLIVLGTFLRGPNWNFFGPFAYWDSHKVDPLNNVNVSQMFWSWMLGKPLEGMPILQREAPGILLVLIYLIVVPPVLARTVFRTFFVKMGFLRYIIMINLLLFMASLPIKMVLRWTLNLKYIIAIPEYFFNI
jgi:hypothetical protein